MVGVSNNDVAKTEAQSERGAALTGSKTSAIGVIDLVGDKEVCESANASCEEILDIDPNDKEATDRAHQLDTQVKPQ